MKVSLSKQWMSDFFLEMNIIVIYNIGVIMVTLLPLRINLFIAIFDFIDLRFLIHHGPHSLFFRSNYGNNWIEFFLRYRRFFALSRPVISALIERILGSFIILRVQHLFWISVCFKSISFRFIFSLSKYEYE